MILRNGVDTENIICNIPHCIDREYDLCSRCKKSLCLYCLNKLRILSVWNGYVVKCPFCRNNGEYNGVELIKLIKKLKSLKLYP